MAEPPIQAPSPSSGAPDADEPSSFFMLVFHTFLFFCSVASGFLITAAVMFLLLALVRYCDTRQWRSVVTSFLDKIPHGTYVVPSSPSLLPSTSDDVPEHQLHHCVICMEEYAGGEQLWVMPACKHVFHEACIKQWLFKPPLTCPICRVRVIQSDDDDADAVDDDDDDDDIETPLMVGTF